MIIYVDTSAALKLLVEEPESEVLAGWLRTRSGDNHLVSSFLLHTELHCAVGRRPVIPLANVDQLLSQIGLIRVSDDLLRIASKQSLGLRSGYAIHLASAISIGADEFVTYDAELFSAARQVGIEPVAPGLDLLRR